MRVVLTRPAEDAASWAGTLQAAGHEVLALPLIAIEALADAEALRDAAARLTAGSAVMFVSANAVRHLARALGGLHWPAGVRAWATGPGTAGALLAAGVPPEQLDTPDAAAGRYDSEALWEHLGDRRQAVSRVLIVRGADASGRIGGRDWLARQLSAAGVAVQEVAAYVRRAPHWDAAQRRQAGLAAADGSVWLFSSSEAVANLAGLLPGTDWSAARAVATHERIAQAARDAGFGVVSPSRASRDAVLATLESIG